MFSLDFYRLDDLLVGAPLYSVKKDGRIIPDAGRVDIFYQTSEVYLFLGRIWFVYIGYYLA